MRVQGPLDNPARSAFLPEKPQIVWGGPSDSSHSYGRGSPRARCGFSGATLWDGSVWALRCVSARLFGITKLHSPKPQRSIPHRPVAPTQGCPEAPYLSVATKVTKSALYSRQLLAVPVGGVWGLVSGIGFRFRIFLCERRVRLWLTGDECIAASMVVGAGACRSYRMLAAGDAEAGSGLGS